MHFSEGGNILSCTVLRVRAVIIGKFFSPYFPYFLDLWFCIKIRRRSVIILRFSTEGKTPVKSFTSTYFEGGNVENLAKFRTKGPLTNNRPDTVPLLSVVATLFTGRARTSYIPVVSWAPYTIHHTQAWPSLEHVGILSQCTGKRTVLVYGQLGTMHHTPHWYHIYATHTQLAPASNWPTRCGTRLDIPHVCVVSKSCMRSTRDPLQDQTNLRRGINLYHDTDLYLVWYTTILYRIVLYVVVVLMLSLLWLLLCCVLW